MKNLIIDIEDISKAANLPLKLIASELFPDNIHADLALRRIMVGDGELSASQIYRLAVLADVEPGQLFSPSPWRMHTTSGGAVLFKKDFTAKIDTNTGYVTVLEKGNLKCHAILTLGAISLSDLIEQIEQLIKN